MSRLHLANGIMSYLSSPLWLLFVISALALGVQYESARHEYFSQAPTLFPLWPRIDPARAARLFAFTMAVLFGPKVLGWLSVVLRPSRFRERGGVIRATCGVAIEVVVSALLAPVQALNHCGVVVDVLRGRSSGWNAQRRDGASLPWSAALYAHRWHTVVGLGLAVVAWSISWAMLAWLSPAVIGMVLSSPLSKLASSTAAGDVVAAVGLLATPEDLREPEIARAVDELVPLYRRVVEDAPDLAAVVQNPRLLKRHLATVDGGPRASSAFDVVEAVAEKKIRDAAAVDEAIARLSPQERGRVLARPSLLGLLVTSPERSARRRAAGMRAPTWWPDVPLQPESRGDLPDPG